jgi:hypothetical protein
VILSAAALVLGGVYVFLPAFLGTSVARGIQDRLALERGTLPEMRAGRFQGGLVTMEDVQLITPTFIAIFCRGRWSPWRGNLRA